MVTYGMYMTNTQYFYLKYIRSVYTRPTANPVVENNSRIAAIAKWPKAFVIVPANLHQNKSYAVSNAAFSLADKKEHERYITST